jgi:CheY-like chemotaxis protein
MPSAETVSDPSSLRPKARLLVVDDNHDLSGMLALLLRRTGYQVDVAGDGPSAIQAALGTVPDVILLDIGLPGMNGHDVARAMRCRPELAQVVLIAMTGYGGEDDVKVAIEAGFNDYLLKPVGLDAIERKLAEFRPKTA